MKNKPKKSKSTKLALSKLKIRGRAPEEKLKDAFDNAPKITNETVAEHREQVLSSARKYIYPLQHSRHRIIAISSTILGAAIILFLVYIGLALYQFQSTSSFIYGVTKVIPLPIAKVGDRWVSYESYLFEVRRYMHYYQTQQQVDFNTTSGKAQLALYKKQAMREVVTNAYADELALKYNVKVTSHQVDREVLIVREQNRLGNNQNEFDAVLSDFWGWNENDFERELKYQVLQQVLAAKLDTSAESEAQSILAKLKQGQNFATLASQASQDTSTKNNGGQFPNLISKNDNNLSPLLTQALFSLKPGQYSGIINTGYTLEIVKLIKNQEGKVLAAHISFNLEPFSKIIAPLENSQKPHYFINY